MIDIPAIKMTLGLKEDINQSDIEEVLVHAKSKSFSANEEIIRHGALDKNIYLILKGLVRTYFVNDKGEEKTKEIRVENQFVFSYETIFRNQPSIYSNRTLESTDLLYLNFQDLEALTMKYPKLLRCRVQFYEYTLGQLEDQVHSLIIKTSEERYLDFLRTNPALAQRVPDKYIANILGISPVQLSRVRKRIATRIDNGCSSS